MVWLSPSAVLLSLTRLSFSIPFKLRQDSSVTTAILDDVTYTNKGLVGFGFIPSDFRESTGDTLGGIGSAIAFKQGTYQVLSNGSVTGTMVVHPDRGFNVDGTVDYQARQFEIDILLNPYYGSDNLDFEDAQKTVQLTYKRTILQFDRNDTKTTGLDALAVRPAQNGFPSDPLADPEMPIASEDEPHLTIDAEGLVANSDGSYWVSDEYGPYIYRFDANGQLIQTIQPPAAILPMDKDGDINFTSDDDPTTGRAGNQGFEGLTLDPINNVLYAMLQSATIQDGGDDKSTSRYTRLVAYDVSDPTVTRPSLVGEWVVPLPLSSKGNTEACSEIHFVSPGIFLALSRDGDGRGGDDNNSKYKNADLFSIAQATDIHGTDFDDPSNPIAKKGKLNKNITPAEYVEFVSFVDDDQLARFGLHNDDPSDETLIDAKWESLALAPVGDPDFPDDYFLFTFADNDFMTTDGISVGQPYDAGLDVDNQVLVFRVTLPSVDPASVEKALGID
ncbi:hypothetical protein D9758_008665 [Tetrapyrgos nigripes]|uniref:Phytase-like domain-containing protein n=1 Tax=Tetrapyrgos nigripes TaxID=182062 RepID=A0A8H5FYQ5_9AGAR|nr:hypothetical protein D9758_008665 [Tetrapyrgos nigripes]